MPLDTFILPLLLTLLFTSIAAVYYHNRYYKQDITLSIVLYGLLVFCIVYFVSFENNIGLGIGLLGILSLIRLRTTLGNLVDIGFIFYSITLGLLNASIKEGIPVIAAVNFFITAILLVLASGFVFKRRVVASRIVFDEIEPETLTDLTALKKRAKEVLKTEPLDVKVIRVDHLKDSVTVKVRYELR